MQFLGDNRCEVLSFIYPDMSEDGLRGAEVMRLPVVIGTLEGDMTVSPGDWVIRGVKGEFYPCKPDIFAATYDEVQPSKYFVGARIRFPLSGHVYNITAVDGDQVTFAFPGDPDDSTTESVADLDSIDVEVLPADPAAALREMGLSMAEAGRQIKQRAAMLGRPARSGGEE
jgi:hypothetical protein